MKKKHVYESLKEFREDRGMSQRELAEKLVYSPNYVGQVELGKLKVTKGFKKKFEEAYGHFGYKVKGINTEEGPTEIKTKEDIKEEVVKAAWQMELEEMKKEETKKNRSLDAARAEVESWDSVATCPRCGKELEGNFCSKCIVFWEKEIANTFKERKNEENINSNFGSNKPYSKSLAGPHTAQSGPSRGDRIRFQIWIYNRYTLQGKLREQ